mgnify:CR=1 FL=1
MQVKDQTVIHRNKYAIQGNIAKAIITGLCFYFLWYQFQKKDIDFDSIVWNQSMIVTLIAVFQVNTWVAAVATTGVILSAAYALWLYRRVVMGDLIKESLRTITDMTTRERWIFAPLIVMTLLLGVYPALVLDIIGPSVSALVASYDTALEAAGAAVQIASE